MLCTADYVLDNEERIWAYLPTYLPPTIGCTLMHTFWKLKLVYAVYDVCNKDKQDSNPKIWFNVYGFTGIAIFVGFLVFA